MTDESIIPFGKYKGKALVNVPASYLLFLLQNNKCGNELKQYIIDNKDVLEHEAKEERADFCLQMGDSIRKSRERRRKRYM